MAIGSREALDGAAVGAPATGQGQQADGSDGLRLNSLGIRRVLLAGNPEPARQPRRPVTCR